MPFEYSPADDFDPKELPPISPVWEAPGEVDPQSLINCMVFEILSMDYPSASKWDIAFFILDEDELHGHQLTDEFLYEGLLPYDAGELQSLSDVSLNNLYKHKCFSADRSAPYALDGETDGWIFDSPKAKADFSFWARMAYWHVAETIALSLGKDPRLVNEKSIEQIYMWETLPFPNEFLKRKELINRAFEFKDLPEKLRPEEFVEWAGKIDLEIPTNLEEQLEQLEIGGSAPWDHFDEESETYPQELHVAVRAWRAVHHQTDTTTTPKELVREWVTKWFPKLSKAAVERIAVVCNWDQRGGRKRKE